VVVDFYADWCQPCKMIAPFFESLVGLYPNVTFLKLNTDMFKNSASKYDITGIPAFIFFKNGAIAHKFVGMDQKELENYVIALQGPSTNNNNNTGKSPSPYKTFPQKDWLTFGSTQFGQLKNKILEINSGLKDDSDEKLNTSDIFDLNQNILKKIENTSYYHSTKFEENEFKVILKLIQWPSNNRLPGLDLLRIMIMHPDAGDHFSSSHLNGQSDDVFSILFSYLLEDISTMPVGQIFLIWRFFANSFKNYQSREITLSMSNEILDLVPLFSSNENKNVRLAVSTTILNFCTAADRDEQLYSIKQTCAPLLTNMISTENDKEVLVRLLVALGTISYHNQDIKLLISSTPLPNVKQEDGQIFDIVNEMKKNLEQN